MFMKNLIHIFTVAVLLWATACSNANQQKQQQDTRPQLPADAIEMKYNDHLYFDVILRDSIPARMIFDTGSSNLLLDSTFYSSYFGKNTNLHKAMLSGAGNGFELTTIDASSWSYRIGEVSGTEQKAIVMDLRKILGDGADGLFGLPFMQDKRVEFNYADGYIRFMTPEEKISEDFTAIQCKWLNNKDRIILPLSVTFADGYTLNGNFLMDTGMPDELSLNSGTTNRLKRDGHLADVGRMIYETGGIGGSRTESYALTGQISIGGKAIKDIRISCSDNEHGAMADNRFDGLAGNGLFARFDVIFDFQNWVIHIRPNKNFDKPQPNDFGIALQPNNSHWVVNGLLEGGNAEKAGLRRGDRIERINGITADDLNARNILHTLPDKLILSVLRDSGLIEIAVGKE